MKKVYLELTSRCNLNCAMCYRNTWDNVAGDMDADLLEGLASDIPTDAGIVFAGIGEPTIARLFRRAVTLFKDHPLEITTNGVIAKETLPFVLENFRRMIISVDATGDAYYHLRKTDFGRVKKTLEAVRRYKKEKETKHPAIDFAFVLSRSNKETIFDVIDTAAAYGVDRILVSHLLPQDKAQAEDIFYTEDKNAEGRAYKDRVNTYAYFRRRIVMSFPHMEIKTERLCPFIENEQVYIDRFGDVVPCYRFANTYKEIVFGREKTVLKHAFGNIREESLAEIYDSRSYRRFREAVKNARHPSCVDCDLRHGCSYIEDTEYDCGGYSPSCADCLWNRQIIRCT